MNKTYHYQLNLPSGSDIIDVGVLDNNFRQIDSIFHGLSEELEPIETSDALDIISASGNPSFYHGAAPAMSLLDNVKTTWGAAVFGQSHGTYSAHEGDVIDLYITLSVKNGTVYWDEYYNAADVPADSIYIGAATCVRENADTTCSFNYVNDTYGQIKKLSLREAIIDLRAKIELLGKGNVNG